MIVLMGMKHCGKTTLGCLLAEKLGAAFVDLDEEMQYLAARKSGRLRTVREIYHSEGEEAFRALETETLRKVAAEHGTKDPAVLALGGGTIENTEALAAIEGCLWVYLDEDEEVLFERIAREGLPPFLAGEDPRGNFRRIYEKRTAMYREKAALTINLRGKTPQETLAELVSRPELSRGR